MYRLLFLISGLMFLSCKNPFLQEGNDSEEPNSIYLPNDFDSSPYQKMKAFVVKIKDGDSFTIVDSTFQEKDVRLLYVDCPEHFQPYTLIARSFTSDAIYKDSVTIYYKNLDQYGRILGIVQFSGNYILNEELLKHGLAWHYTQYSEDKKYQAIQDSTQENHIGIFEEEEAIEPWNWRRRNKRF